ncbi:MAG TPA: amidohydrolase family protein [Ramlibacter sp.]|nr:amidohydrolase family protein [Ramlibacter sp.]
MKIDIHHHFLPRSFLDSLEQYLPTGLHAVREGEHITMVRTADNYAYPKVHVRHWSDPATQIEMMDAAGVDHAIVSTACFQDWMTLEAARIINDGTAELVRTYPTRFSGMISAPPDGGEAMVEEIRRARALGLCAVNMTTTHGDRYPDHPDFRLLFATAAEMDLPVFIHPSWIGPVTTYMDKWNTERTLGKPFDMTLGIARMLFSGEFERHANLRMVWGHLGGNLAMMRHRLFASQPGYLTAPGKDYEALLRRNFVDTAPGMWQTSEEIGYVGRKLGADQLMLGSDYPLSVDPSTIMKHAVAHVSDSDLSEEHKQKIFSRNAVKVFDLKRLEEQAGGGAGRLSVAMCRAGCC